MRDLLDPARELGPVSTDWYMLNVESIECVGSHSTLTKY